MIRHTTYFTHDKEFPPISASLFTIQRTMRTLFVWYGELGRLSKHASTFLFAETFKLLGIFTHIVER